MIHVAVLLKPYLDLILQGKKTVECRLTRDARDPYENIEPGDRIYFKRSAGPYAALGYADHVLFESNLTPKRVSELRRDYNHLICGEPAYWNRKKDSRYGTLIWLRDVTPIDHGPQIRPLQGVAWLALDEEPAWRRLRPSASRATAAATTFYVPITAGNLRNNTLYVTQVVDRFPASARGGRTKSEAGVPVTLMLHDGPTVQSDIVGPRNMLRTRVWGAWFRRHGARPGDHVLFTPVDERCFTVGLARGKAS